MSLENDKKWLPELLSMLYKVELCFHLFTMWVVGWKLRPSLIETNPKACTINWPPSVKTFCSSELHTRIFLTNARIYLTSAPMNTVKEHQSFRTIAIC